MCVGDWRLGRMLSINIQAFNITSGVGVTLNPNRQRVGVSIGLSEAAFAATDCCRVLVDDTPFTMISLQSPFFHCTLVTHGLLPTRKFTVAAGASIDAGAYIEYIAPEEYLAMAIESFKTQYGIGR